MLELNAVDLVSQLGKKLSISSKTMERAKALVLRLSKAKGVAYTLSSFDVVSINKSLMEFSRRNGISLQEAHSIYIAKKLNGILVSDDAKTRQVSRSYGVPAVPTLSLLSYARSQGLVNNNYFKELVMKMATIPFMVPKDLIG